ncbi:MAG: hypothetical protein R2706_03260 [Acidimicrobiales bacterium]
MAAASFTPETTSAWLVNPVGPLHVETSRCGVQRRVTKHLVASMLGNSPSTISNIPAIGDVDITARMLEALGCEVAISDSRATIDPRPINSSRVPVRFSGMNRRLMVGPLLHRVGGLFVPLVGDDIGSRPIDFSRYGPQEWVPRSS